LVARLLDDLTLVPDLYGTVKLTVATVRNVLALGNLEQHRYSRL
jgi:hypothetical protein